MTNDNEKNLKIAVRRTDPEGEALPQTPKLKKPVRRQTAEEMALAEQNKLSKTLYCPVKRTEPSAVDEASVTSKNPEDPVIFTKKGFRGDEKMEIPRMLQMTPKEENGFDEGSEGTYGWLRRKKYKLFDAVLIILQKKQIARERYSPNGSMTGCEATVSFIVQLQSAARVWQSEVRLEELQRGIFLSKISEGEVVLEEGAKVKKLYSKLIQEKIRQRNFPVIRIYTTPGWKKISNGEYGYVTPQGVIGRPDLKIFSKSEKAFGVSNRAYQGQSIARDFLQMRCVLQNHREYAVLFQIYFIAALLRGLLRELDMAPQFVLAIIGKTNSKKTTLANHFFKLYDRQRQGVDIDFTATKVAFEEAMGRNADAVTIFDDITPPNTRTSERDLKEKLEILVRGFGGNTPRKRSQIFAELNPGATAFTPILCSGVITGEVFPVTLASSRSRVVKVELERNDCDVAELTRQQMVLEILPAFAVSFLTFVTEQQSSLGNMLSGQFISLRRGNPLNLQIPRFAETYALLLSILTVFGEYLTQTGQFRADEISALMQQDQCAIAAVLRANDQEATMRPDEVLIAECLVYACQAQEGYESSNPLERIYRKNDFLLVHPQYLLKLLKEYYVRNGKIFQHSSVPELSKFLDSNGMIRTLTEGSKLRYTLKATANEVKNARFYYFYTERVLNLADAGTL